MALSGDTSEFSDSEYLDMWNALEDLEKSTTYRFTRRRRRDQLADGETRHGMQQQDAVVADHQDDRFSSEMERWISAERERRLTAEHRAQELTTALLVEQRNVAQLQRLNVELSRQRRELGAQLDGLRDAARIVAERSQLEAETPAQRESNEELAVAAQEEREVAALRLQVDELRIELAEQRQLVSITRQRRIEAEERAARELAEVRAVAREQAKLMVTPSAELDHVMGEIRRHQLAAADASKLLAIRDEQVITVGMSLSSRDNAARTLQRDLELARLDLTGALAAAATEKHQREQLESRLELETLRAEEAESRLSEAEHRLAKCHKDLADQSAASRMVEAAIDLELSRRHRKRVREALETLKRQDLSD